MTTLCPKCGKDDSIQKVSAIVSSGTYQTTYKVPMQGQLGGHAVYGMVNQTSQGMTDLAQKLSLPSDKDWKKQREYLSKTPKENKYLQDYLRVHPQPGPEPLRIVRIPLQLCGVLLALGALCAFSTDVRWGLLLSAGVIAFIVADQVIYRRFAPQDYQEWERNRKRYHPFYLTLRLRQRAEANYHKLYYCYRDDVVFMPGEAFCVNAANMGNMGGWMELGREPVAVEEPVTAPRR